MEKLSVKEVRSKPCTANPKLRVPAEVEQKILHLRATYHLGPVRIVWYLKRYHDIKVSSGGVYSVLKRNSMNRLPRNARKRTVLTQRYGKQVPGHHVQVDVKFLDFKAASGEKVRRFQYTAIYDATRIRALKIYEKHSQQNAMDFIDHVVAKFPWICVYGALIRIVECPRIAAIVKASAPVSAKRVVAVCPRS